MDRETAVSILRDQYGDVSMQLASVNASVDREVREYRRNLIAKRTYEVEKVFADKIREAYDNSGITIQDIQTVIGTSDWKRTKKWRDLAGIPSREQKRAIREYTQKYVNAPFLWNDDYTVLTVRRDPAGNALPTPVDLDRGSMFAMAGKHWFMEGAGEENVKLNNAYFREHKLAWAKMLDAEITKQFEAGNLADLPAKQ